MISTQKPPMWNQEGEEAENLNYMLRYKVVPCTEYRLDNCCASNCFEYHEDDESRRPVVDNKGNLLYWDELCEHIAHNLQCPFGYGCLFAHTTAERLWHPGQFVGVRGKPRTPGQYSYGYKEEEPPVLKYRFCSYFPSVENCKRRELCRFAHAREELSVPLLTEDEENKLVLTNDFLTKKFKLLWCPIGVQHDWQTCVYAHNYQDARRNPAVGYGPKPCPYWDKKKDRVPGYEKRCPNGFACPFAHGAKEQLYHPLYFKTVVCWDISQSRSCPRGELCAFYHARKVQRKAGEDRADYDRPLGAEAMRALQPYFRNPPAFTAEEKRRDWEARGYESSPGLTPMNEPPKQHSPIFFLPPSPKHDLPMKFTPVNSTAVPSPYDSPIAARLEMAPLLGDLTPMTVGIAPEFPAEQCQFEFEQKYVGLPEFHLPEFPSENNERKMSGGLLRPMSVDWNDWPKFGSMNSMPTATGSSNPSGSDSEPDCYNPAFHAAVPEEEVVA